MEVLLVMSPGVAVEAYTPLIQELRSEGASVTPVSFPCSGDAATFGAQVARAADGREVVVVAHGVGATLALSVAERLSARRWVLLGPALDVVPGPGLKGLAALELPEHVDLASVPAAALRTWAGVQDADLVGCVSPTLAREIQGWIAAGHVPVDPTGVAVPVSVALGSLDEVAPVEATIPVARRFPQVEVVRLGIARLDPQDYEHIDLVREPVPIRWAARAAAGTTP